MDKVKPTSETQKLVDQLQLTRIQLTKAEASLEAAKKRARLAKRRRKEAKLAARRAKKEVKRAKTGVAEAKEAVAALEAKLAQARRPRPRKQTAARPGKQVLMVKALSRREEVTPSIPGPQTVAPTPAEFVADLKFHPKGEVTQETAATPEQTSEGSGASAPESAAL